MAVMSRVLDEKPFVAAGVVTDSGRPGRWQQDGACNSHDPELFFVDPAPASASAEKKAERAGQIAQAKQVCGGCPVADMCLAYALVVGERHGTWGGLTGPERQKLQHAPVPGTTVEVPLAVKAIRRNPVDARVRDLADRGLSSAQIAMRLGITRDAAAQARIRNKSAAGGIVLAA